MNSDLQTSVESSLRAMHALPLGVSVLLGCVAAGFAIAVYMRERGKAGVVYRGLLAGIRAGLLMLVLWMLFGWSVLQYTTSRPELIVVLDRSGSMQTQDVGRGNRQNSRLRFALDRLGDYAGREGLARHYQTRWYWAGEGAEQAELNWSNGAGFDKLVDGYSPTSRLGDSLSRIVNRQAGSGVAAIVFISDGINTAGSTLQDVARDARRAAVPIYCVALGRQETLPDVRVTDALFEREMYLGDQGVIDLSVVATDAGAATTRVILRDTDSEEILDSVRVQFGAEKIQQTVRLRFEPDHASETHLSVTADSLPGEQDLENNTSEITVNVQDRTIKVLMVFSRPSYEFRFLKHFLERSQHRTDGRTAAFEVDCVLQEADAEYVLQDPSAIRLVPTTREELSEYDAFVLGDFDPRLVSRSAQVGIRDSVLEGGAGCMFVLGGGEPTRSLVGWEIGDLMPSTLVGYLRDGSTTAAIFRWQPTELGQLTLPLELSAGNDGRSVWQQLPSFSSLAKTESIKPGAQVWANTAGIDAGSSHPVLVSQFAGAGRVVLQLTDETYRWTSFKGSDAVYQGYWGHMLRQLTRGRLAAQLDAELRVEPRQARFGEPVELTLMVPRAAAGRAEYELRVFARQGRDRVVRAAKSNASLGTYQATVSDFPPGSYRAAWLEDGLSERISQEFTVSAPPGEQANLKSDVEALQMVAGQSRGRFYEGSEIHRMLSELPEGRRTRLGALPPKPIWNHPWIAALFLGMLAAEWLLRRRARML